MLKLYMVLAYIFFKP